MDNSTTGVH